MLKPPRGKKLTTCWPPAHRSQTSGNQKIDTWESWKTILLPHPQPNRRIYMSQLHTTLSFALPLKTLPWKPLSSLCLLTIVVDRSPCLVPGNKHCTFLHHSLVSIDDFAVRQASRPKLGWMTDNYISAQREEGRWTREPGLEEQHGDEFSGFSFCLRGACSGYWEILMCLACCDSWGCKESDTTEQLIWSDAC